MLIVTIPVKSTLLLPILETKKDAENHVIIEEIDDELKMYPYSYEGMFLYPNSVARTDASINTHIPFRRITSINNKVITVIFIYQFE